MIKMLRGIPGMTDNIQLTAGLVVDLGPVIEEQMVRQGYAEYVATSAAPETAEAKPAAENAARRTAKPKPRAKKSVSDG